MNRNNRQHRDDLKVIARRAMIDHGLLPDFSPEVIAELSSIEKTQPPVEGKLVRGFDGLDVGDRVHVELIRTDVEQGFIDFARRH